MSTQHLIEMVNDIGAYFAFEPDRSRALQGFVSHIERYWEPRMRHKLIAAFIADGGRGLDPLVHQGVQLLHDREAASLHTS